jgi:propionyl-CoA synthetase
MGILKTGAVVVPLFSAFGEDALIQRMEDCRATAVITQRRHAGKVRKARERLPDLKTVIVIDHADDSRKLREGEVAYSMMRNQAASFPVARTWAESPSVLHYTSGTTGQPKGVVRPTAGHLVALHWTMKNIYGVEPGDVYWAASDVGWVVGHSYICYAPLIHGNTTVVFEGKPVGTPDAGTFWRVIEEHDVKVLFTAPTAFRAIKRQDPQAEFLKTYNTSCLKTLFLAGERADPDTIHWAEDKLGVPVIDHWWQTETGWAIAANPMGIEHLPVKVGSPSVPMPGWDVQILDEAGHPVGPDTLGAIAVKLPLPPGTLPTLWQAEARFRKSYLEHFPGYYETGDAGYVDADGYLYIMARTDDVINVAGHRLSTGGMEEVLASHPDVAECAVIGVTDQLKGQLPVGFLCLSSGVTRGADEIVPEVVKLVRDKIGPVAAFKLAVVVDRLPKTRSGKILRATMVKIADGEDFKMPATIDDPAILDEIRDALKTIGYAGG